MSLPGRILAAALAALLVPYAPVQSTYGYALNEVVPDVRKPSSASGGSACPVHAHQLSAPGGIAFRWSTALNSNPQTIFTADSSTNGRLNELEQSLQQSLNTWTSVSATALSTASLAPLVRTATQSACGADGLNSICFDQADAAFTPGVLAFTRVITADSLGMQVGTGAASTELGQILDADVYFNPSDSFTTFATPSALASHPKSYDLQSVLTHELGHALGFSHSALWGAMMFPYAPGQGTYSGARPTSQQPDAPLADDDRTGLRVLYPEPKDTQFTGSIQGRILPANPLALPLSPPGVTGIFGSHVVAVNASNGNIVTGVVGGWSCSGAGPVQFDGNYRLEKLPIGQNYLVYAEPLNGAVSPDQMSNSLVSLCRNVNSDPGWPTAQTCVVPQPDLEFTTRLRPAP